MSSLQRHLPHFLDIFILMQKFNISEDHLNRHLFSHSKPLYGPAMSLNVHYLPDLLAYIKTRLSQQQRVCLLDYEFESYLMELAGPKDQEGRSFSSVERLQEHIVSHIRSSTQFWVRNSSTWNKVQGLQEDHKKDVAAIKAYQTELQALSRAQLYFKQEKIKNFVVSRQRLIQQNYMHYNYFEVDRVHERVSTNIMVLLFEFIELKGKSDSKRLQYFLLDMLLCKEKRVRRKRQPTDEDLQNSPIFGEFVKFAGDQPLQQLLLDPQAEFNAITNILQCYELISSLEQADNCQGWIQLRDTISKYLWDEEQCEKVVRGWLRHYNDNRPKLQSIQSKHQHEAKAGIPGCLVQEQEIRQVQESWREFLQNPQYKQLSSYKYDSNRKLSWNEEDYRKFLQGLILYWDQTVNNKKIAVHIRGDVQSNHVKHVKRHYLNNIKQRMENGESGGGYFGGCISKKQFVQNDLSNFSMKWFNKTKAIKKRKKLCDSDAMQSESDYK